MMFEGKPPKPDAGASLQAVSWADLSARLAAARDLRQALADEAHGEGSFDAASARWIADHVADHDDDEHGGGKPAVNPDDLGNRKAVDGMARPSARWGGRGKE